MKFQWMKVAKRRNGLAKAAAAAYLWAAAIALPLALQAQQLVAWPIGSPGMRMILPGDVVRPMPMPRPLPRPPATIGTPGTVGQVVLPSPRPLPRELPPMEPQRYNLEGTVNNTVANIRMEIDFRNPSPQRLEGVLIVPIPAETVMDGFSMVVGGKKMNGELLESDKAAAIYQTIVNQTRDPGLLELVGERMFRARVFPIEPNGVVQAQVNMTQVLRQTGGLYNLRIPLKSAQLAGGAGVSMRLKLESQKPFRSLYSPNPDVKINKSDDRHAEVEYSRGGADAGDLNVFYSLEEGKLGAGMLTYREEGEDGFFMLSLSPKARSEEKDATPKDMVFVFDRSGSMNEDGKIDQAKRALRYSIQRLSENDRFGIVDFATDARSFESRLVAANAANKARALRYIDRIEAAGGTNIEAALEEGLSMLRRDSERLSMVYFMTDGLPTVGATNMGELLRRAQSKNSSLQARVFTFGVGHDVNTLFLDKLAESNQGAHDYVAPGEDLENKVSALFQKVAKPALTGVRFEWIGADVDEVYPRPIRDVFYGSDLLIMGRYHGAGGSGKLVITGRAGGREQRFELPVSFPKSDARHAFVPRLWAHLKVASELDAVRLSGNPDPEVVKDIVKLAKRYGIVTPYTSYLITEEGRDIRVANMAAVRGANQMAFDAASSGGGAGNWGGIAPMSSAGMGSPQAMHQVARRAQMASRKLEALKAAASPAQLQSQMALEEKEARDGLLGARKDAAALRQVAGKTFYKDGGRWVDGAVGSDSKGASKHRVAIKYMSQEYFDLLNARPELARFLAIGPQVTVAWAGTVYEIVD